MKHCPACGTTYTDDSLSFCLSDGAALGVAPEQPTAFKRGDLRADSPSAMPSTVVMSGMDTGPKSSSGIWLKILLAIAALGIFGIAALGLAGAFFYYGTGEKEKQVTENGASPSPTTDPPRPDREKERLRDELANVQQRLEEQKKANSKSDLPTASDERNSLVKGTVNSPNDGFLALRNIPDADRGVRIAKIPHGSEVELNNCEKAQVTIAGRNGRWCQVEYNGQTGWVFDGWLDY